MKHLPMIIFSLLFFQMNYSQSVKKDILIFDLNTEYLKNFDDVSTSKYYLLLDSGEAGLFFETIKSYKRLQSNKKPICFKEYIESASFFRKDHSIKIYSSEFMNYFSNYVVFLKNENEFLLVAPGYEVE